MTTTTQIDTADINFDERRTVWFPTTKAPQSPWWGQIPRLITEGNDLSPREKEVYGMLVTRQAGDRGFPPHGEAYLAALLGCQPRTFARAAESLADRGMIRITKDGQKTKHYEVLWAPQWRAEDDPPEKWNPPIRLGLQPQLAKAPTTPKSEFDRMSEGRDPDEDVVQIGHQWDDNATIARTVAKSAMDDVEDATQSCTKACYEGEVVRGLGASDLEGKGMGPDCSSDLDPFPDCPDNVDPLTGEIFDIDIPDTANELLTAIDQASTDLSIMIPANVTDATLSDVKGELRRHPGWSTVYMHVGEKEFRLPLEFRVTCSQVLLSNLNSRIGVCAQTSESGANNRSKLAGVMTTTNGYSEAPF